MADLLHLPDHIRAGYASAARDDSLWDALRARVEPLLGDLEGHLGPHWSIQLDRIFSKLDVLSVLSNGDHTAHRPWYVVEFTEAGAKARLDHDLAYTATFGQGAAALLEACRDRRVLPTDVTLDPTRARLELWLGEEAMARVYRIDVRPVSKEIRRRVESTVLGLRKFDNEATELIKRVQRWPGLQGVQLSEREVGRPSSPAAYPAGEHAHHPVPAEWLLSARVLCARCGAPSPTRALLEQVAAAAFDVRSWNHLAACQPLPTPWAIIQDGVPGAQPRICGFYADGIDAFGSLLARAPTEFIRDWDSAALSLSEAQDMPIYSLNRRFRASGSAASFYEERESYVALPADHAIWEDDSLAATLDQALARADLPYLKEAFGIDVSLESRLAMSDGWAGEALLLQDGNWRFTMRGKSTRAEEALFARRYGPNGNCVEATSVYTRKGEIRAWREHVVLCGDYDGTRPQIIMDGLSVAAVETLLRVLKPHTMGEKSSPRSIPALPRVGESDARKFSGLVEAFEKRLAEAQL